LVSNQLPARRRIELEIQHQMDLGQRELQKSREEFEEGKITRGQAYENEQQYTALVVALRKQRAAALKDEAKAEHETMLAMGQELAAGVAGLIAGRRAQAGVEAVFEIARGVQMLAEGIWPPNPAAIMAAGLHFEAAAQYAKMAGSGSSRHSVSGGGGGFESGRYSGSEGTRADRNRPDQFDPNSLAPGDASPSGRLGNGLVIVHGEADFQSFIAGTINAAVDRGITVTATSSQRGAPVGH
jgi:hypothetical protein